MSQFTEQPCLTSHEHRDDIPLNASVQRAADVVDPIDVFEARGDERLLPKDARSAVAAVGEAGLPQWVTVTRSRTSDQVVDIDGHQTQEFGLGLPAVGEVDDDRQAEDITQPREAPEQVGMGRAGGLRTPLVFRQSRVMSAIAILEHDHASGIGSDRRRGRKRQEQEASRAL
jgi:hypothetical protein